MSTLKTININSKVSITPTQLSFIEEVSLCFDEHRTREDNFVKTPVFFINEASMIKHDPEEFKRNEEFKPHTELLGFYRRDSSGLFEKTPMIAICPERIASCVQNDEEFLFLLTKVIIHEFAHAKMDNQNQNITYHSKDEFWRWMEESSANRYTLSVLSEFKRTDERKVPYRSKGFSDRLFDFAVDFIKRQEPAYALGHELFEKRPLLDWEWERAKDVLGSQKRAKEKQEWLAYMKSNYKNIDKEHASYLYDSLFEGEKIAMSNSPKEKLKCLLKKKP